jgi:hypothetical protein
MTFVRFTHEPNLDGVFPPPVPALKKAPDFYKAIRPQSGSHPETSTVKRCIPFLDALSAGFIIPLWADLHVVAKDGELSLSFPRNFPMSKSLEQHGYIQFPGHPFADKPYGKNFLKFMNPWVIETAPGYSCLFTTPLNHLEPRFKLIDGAVDTDTYHNNINFPFLWTGGDGEFFIPKGTPLVQVIPYKRETFTLEVGVTNVERRDNVKARLGTYIKDAYRREFWSKAKTLDDDYEEEMDVDTDTAHPDTTPTV